MTRKTVDAQIGELKLTPVHSSGSCPSFVGKPYVRKELNAGTGVIDFESLEVLYPHLEPILLKYSYGDVEMILRQDVFHCIHLLEFFGTDRRNTPISIRLQLGWVLSGPLPSTSGLISTCFKAVTQRETHSTLADQICRLYDVESIWAYKQVEPRYAADACAQKILQDTTYHDLCRYHVGMLWADDQISLPKNFFIERVQLKSLEPRLGKDPILKIVVFYDHP